VREREDKKDRDDGRDGRDGGVWVYPHWHLYKSNPLMGLLGVTLYSAISIKLVFSLNNDFHSSTSGIYTGIYF
jgi:hypothetical protein